MRTGIVAIIALVVGAAIGYYYEKTAADKLSAHVAEIEAQIAQEMEKTKSAAAQVDSLKAEVAAKAKEIEEKVARITELESKQSDSAPAAGEAEPAAQ